MTDGTSQGLFVVVAIVIFGVFVALSYTVFGNAGLSGGINNLFENALEDSLGNNNGKINMTPVDFDLTQAGQWAGRDWELNEETKTVTFSSNSQYRGGLSIDESFFEIGETYTLRFDMRKISGDILGIGGHLQTTDAAETYINGVRKTTRWHDGEEVPNNWNSAVSYPNTQQKVLVETTFTYGTVSTSTGNHVYIQPNRHMGNYLTNALNFRVEISNLELLVHD